MNTTRKTIPSASLQEIANWQLDPEASALSVDLPKLQRGFVWEPPRIINLWDSLLRGFPIGSLLLSEIGDRDALKNEADKYWLLDGQQRATSIAMGFYNPWNGHPHLVDANEKHGWPLKVIPVLWIDVLPKGSADEKLFFPYLVTQSHPWGYNQSGAVLSWGARKEAWQVFAAATDTTRYTSLALKDVFPWAAKLPVPMSFVIESSREPPGNDANQFKESLLIQCQHLPKQWQSRFGSQLAELSAPHLSALREASHLLTGCDIHLNYLNLRTRGNDGTNSADNSILFVRMNTGGKELRGEELIFSLYKSEFPKAKDAVEKAAAEFMPPSRLFSLLIRLIAADHDPSKLHIPITLRDFKLKIAESVFKERLEGFIGSTRLAEIVAEARELLTGNHAYSLPPALATRTIKGAPDVFLAMLHWLYRGGSVKIESPEHQSLLATVTALSWFAPGNAQQKQLNLRQWMECTQTRPIGEFWRPENIRTLFTQPQNPIPSFPDPIGLQNFLENAIMEMRNEDYKWEILVETCSENPIFDGYSRTTMPDEGPSTAEPDTPSLHVERENLRKKFVQENLRNFIGVLRGNTHLLLFAQRNFIVDQFQDFQQWDLVLDDTNTPWDWDHIYPSAYWRHDVDPKYRQWHNTIGNKRAEALSLNRKHGDAEPKIKLADLQTRKDSFISDDVWQLIQTAPQSSIKDSVTAKILCRIILRRMAQLYGEWYATLGIGQLMSWD
jgi:hypothetical protein